MQNAGTVYFAIQQPRQWSSAMSPKDIVAQFISDIHAQRFDEAKTLLAEDGFEYVGPNMRFLSRDDMLAYQFGMAAIQKDLVLRQLSADGEHVFAILDYRTHFEPKIGRASCRERGQVS